MILKILKYNALFILFWLIFQVCKPNPKKPDNQHISNIDTVSVDLFSNEIFSIGDSLNSVHLFDSALKHHTSAIKHFEKEKNWRGVAVGLCKIGSSYIYKGEPDSAIILLKKGVEISETQSYYSELTESSYWLGLAYRWERSPEEALKYLNKSLHLILNGAPTGNISLGKCYKVIGDVHRWLRSDYENAEKNYVTALNLLESDTASPDKQNLFLLCYNIASTSKQKKDLKKALIYADKALQYAEDSKHKQADIYIALSYSIKGNIYLELKEQNKSRTNLNLALNIFEKKGSDYGNYITDLLLNLALTYGAHDSINKTQILLIESLRAFQIYAPNNLSGVTSAHEHLSDFYAMRKEYEQALHHLRISYMMKSRKLNKSNLSFSETYSRFGNLFLHWNRTDSALTYFKKAIELHSMDTLHVLPKKLNFSDLTTNNLEIITPLRGLALSLHKKFLNDSINTHHLNMARNCYYLIDTIYAKTKNDLAFESSKLITAKAYKNICKEAIDCNYLLYQHTKDSIYLSDIYYFMEKSNARILYDKLIKAKLYNKAGIPDSIYDLERDCIFNINYFSKKIDGITDSILRQNYKNLIFEHSRKLENIKKHLTENYPNYYSIKYSYDVASLEQLRRHLQLNNKCIAQYFIGDTTLYCLIIRPSKLSIRKISINSSILEAHSEYVKLIAEDGKEAYSIETFHRFCKASNLLYNTLLDSQTIFHNNKNEIVDLTIIPDNYLSRIPFEALITNLPTRQKTDFKSLPYLVKKINISYAYSSSLTIKDSPTSFEKSTKQTRKIKRTLLMSYDMNPIAKNRHNQTSNAKVLQEMTPIMDITRSTSFLGAEASKQNFLHNAANFDLIHLSVHGKIDSSNSFEPNLIFYKNDSDNVLAANEVYNLNLSSKLVVLSACESGLGQYEEGEGSFSMARAFTYAGCPSLIKSLWQAKDLPTIDIVNQLYKYLINNIPIDEALRKSKINFIDNSDELSAHPANWASLILLGDAEPLRIYSSKRVIRNEFVIGSLSLLVGLVILTMFKTKKKRTILRK